MTHPYAKAPATAFWNRSVSNDYSAKNLVAFDRPLIESGQRVASAGSCFAANIIPHLKSAGFSYPQTERFPSHFASLPDNFNYRTFSAAYGNIYTMRQAAQLLARATGGRHPIEDRWYADDGLVLDPYRPGLRFPAGSDAEFDCLIQQHLARVESVFRSSDVFIFTLGLTEAWISQADGSVFPACPGTVSYDPSRQKAGIFDVNKHKFRNFSVQELAVDIDDFVRIARGINPGLRIILTVSPVPLVATATDNHVLLASTYSKSVLRVAAQEATARHANIFYFPAYEIVTGPQSPFEYFESDRRSVSKAAVEDVMSAFLNACEGSSYSNVIETSDDLKYRRVGALSEAIAQAQCEEEALDR